MSRHLTAILDKPPGEKPRLELVEAVKENLTAQPNSPPENVIERTHLPTNEPANLPTPARKQPISPEKDFAKVPNSIKRFVEAGKFPNSSLAIYMYLYSLTRGAIHPKRSVRVNKAKLSNGSDLRSEKALLKNLAHLKGIGLLKITIFSGDHAGNEYEVFVPEEITGDAPSYLPTRQPTYLPTKDTPLPTVQTSVGRTVAAPENIDENDALRLFFKDNTKNDDEAFAAMLDVLKKMTEKATGKKPQKSDGAKWKELGELLAMEFEIAAARADSVSSVPAFLTEHLRRRLTFNRLDEKQSKPLKKTVKESVADAGIYEPEPLTEQGRETVCAAMRGYIEKGQTEFVMSLKDTYTPEDWSWLKINLKTQQTD
jgi:hypothetical protein